MFNYQGTGFKARLDHARGVLIITLQNGLRFELRLNSGLDLDHSIDNALNIIEQTHGLQTSKNTKSLIFKEKNPPAGGVTKEIFLDFFPEGFTYYYTVSGKGMLNKAHFFRSKRAGSPAPNGCGGPVPFEIFNPDPTGDNRPFSDGKKAQVISIASKKETKGGNWFFTPGPFCFAAGGEKDWLTFGLVADRGEWRFESFSYPGPDFGFTLDYNKNTVFDGLWTSPRMVCLTASDPYQGLTIYNEWYKNRYKVFTPQTQKETWPTQPGNPSPTWHKQPIFCGWGEQVSQTYENKNLKAANFATQANYKTWLGILEKKEIKPGTIVIDDKWQKCYGINDIDKTKWPDLPGFVKDCHANGQHVLLWLKAWDWEGLPKTECILNSKGEAVACDPTNPAYRDRFCNQLKFLVNEVGIDGFKLDFTHKIPHSPGLALNNNSGGMELLREWLALVSTTLHVNKPDGFLISHCVNPYLLDLTDAFRLNDFTNQATSLTSLKPALRHRVRVIKALKEDALIDSDNWPCYSKTQWQDYLGGQATGEFGIPALYFATRIAWGDCNSYLDDYDYSLIRTTWASYRASL